MKSLIQKVKAFIGIDKAPVRPKQPTRPERKVAKNTCYFCKRKNTDFTAYYNEQNRKIKVCTLCLEYAERRAYKKK